MEAAPSLSASLPPYTCGPTSQALQGRRSLSSDVHSPLSPDASTERPPFTSARLTQHNASQPRHDPLNPFGSAPQQQQQYNESPLRRSSLSLDKDPHTQNGARNILQKIQRSSSGGSAISKLPNSLPGSLSEVEGGGSFQRPAGLLAEAGTIGRGSGSSLTSSIFGEPNQWVIDYSDLVSDCCYPCLCVSCTVARSCTQLVCLVTKPHHVSASQAQAHI